MQPRNCRNHCAFIAFFLIFLVALALSGGCKSDSGPTSPIVVTYPTVAQNWQGKDLNAQGQLRENIAATFTQTADTLKGSWVWTVGTYMFTEQLTGNITTKREIALRGTSFGGAISTSSPRQHLGAYIAALSAQGDSISGSWTESSGSGTFILIKQ
jgi:hypothetical protein